MKPIRPYGAGAVLLVIFFALATVLCAQEATPPKHTGVPQDWTQHQIVFTRDALARQPDLIDREPRILHQEMQRWQVPNFGVFQAADPLPTSVKKSGLHRDWNVNLSGRLVADTFPAKFSFDPIAAPDCINDYVVFGLAAPEAEGGSGTGVNANFVGFNNLYSDPIAHGGTGDGLCDQPPFTGLAVLFAYNITTVTGGRVATSPVLSEDGKQIAFVESIPANAGLGIPAQAIFHVLTWTAGGSLTAAAAPTMTSVPLVGPAPTFATANDTTSSPWVDYGADTAYVGTDNGVVYQIVGVFKSASTLSGSPWPITLSSNFHLSPPVLDANLGLLMVGSGNGNLYQINITPPAAVTKTLSVGDTLGGTVTTPGVLAPPVVDITNGTTFAVSAFGTNTAVLVQADTATLGGNLIRIAEIGEGSTGGTHLILHQPAFSNAYYNDPSTGVISFCGTGTSDTTPWQYTFGFTVPVTRPIMNTTGPFTQLSTNPADRCTGWTEFFNPNVGVSPGTDFFFFGLTGDCETIFGGGTTGCVVALANNNGSTTVTTAPVTGGPSGVVVDNFSSAAQASSIYFTAEGLQTAYKFTQSGLQ